MDLAQGQKGEGGPGDRRCSSEGSGDEALEATARVGPGLGGDRIVRLMLVAPSDRCMADTIVFRLTAQPLSV